METENPAESITEKLIRIKFIYDPNFKPSWFAKGEIDYEEPKASNPPWLYALVMNEEWNKRISPLVSPQIKRVLGVLSDFFEPFKCYILEHRVKVADGLFIEANSHPLAIWAKPFNLKWGSLPFHARLIHEFCHIFGPNYSPLWDQLEDRVWNTQRDNKDFWTNQILREELVVRHTTHLITGQVFGRKFADWFLSQESKIIPS